MGRRTCKAKQTSPSGGCVEFDLNAQIRSGHNGQIIARQWTMLIICQFMFELSLNYCYHVSIVSLVVASKEL